MAEKTIGSSVHRVLNQDKTAFQSNKTGGYNLQDTLRRLHGDPLTKLTKEFEKNPSLLKQIESDITHLYEHGYVVLNNLLSAQELKSVRNVTNSLLDEAPQGRNGFEGRKTQRVYGLLGKSRVYDQFLLHPRIRGIIDLTLLPNHLLTAFQAINILPNEEPQTPHYDDEFVGFSRPRKHTSIAFIWAIDDFTKENGATMFIPGSHKWGDSKSPSSKDFEEIGMSAIMPAGSCLCMLSTLWHCGGRNKTKNKSRLAITNQHCEPFIRPQENQFLSVPFDIIDKLDPRIQSMLGYSIHYPFIGHSDGLHPKKALPKLLNRYKALSKL